MVKVYVKIAYMNDQAERHLLARVFGNRLTTNCGLLYLGDGEFEGFVTQEVAQALEILIDFGVIARIEMEEEKFDDSN